MATPLYNRSYYSLLSSMLSIESIVLKCKEYGYKSVAIVDKNVLAGAMAFKKACQNENLKPIYGMSIDMEINGRVHEVALYAKNDEGYQNLMALSSYLGTHDDKLTSLELFNKYKSGNLVVLFSDDMPLTYYVDKKLDLKEALSIQNGVFGSDYYVALVDHDIAINANRDSQIKPFLNERGIKTLAISRTLYPNKDDYEEFEVLKCIKEKRTLEDNYDASEVGRYFKSQDEMMLEYENDDLTNTDVFASLCNVKMDFKTSLPEFKGKLGISSKDYLISLCKEGLKRRLKGNVPKEYVQRLDYELKVILKMHFEDYFLIVYDFILYAKKNNIMVGPGRGSAAGSLVSYCLGITDIDPLKYGLLFERFLNPERISMPDIDTDFPDDKRDEVIQYVANKYGKEHVAHIITYGTLKAKQVLRDVGRVLNYSVGELDVICKLIPFSLDMSLEKAYEVSPIFRQKIDSSNRYRHLFDVSKKLEGFPRHESTHAAGIVMSSKKLSEVVPLVEIENDIYSTQYTMEYLESLGLIKMDFLGLRNLSIIAEVVDDINKDETFNIKEIPLDDKKTFDLIDNVNVLGVFQLESSGMMNLIRKMKPKTFEEIGITIALFRPGPMENIPQFLENRAHPESVNYLHKDLKPILEETYGIIIYQEQIMTIARVMAGFSYGKADILRKAMSKKKAEELVKLKDDFIEGCIKNGYDKVLAQNVYDLILKFANYGFNKSHSIAYAMVAYEMAYLKANYPLYFYKALLNGVIGSETKTYEYINECLNVKQKVKGISINDSSYGYIIKDNAIIMPFGSCKDVGSVSCKKIIEERENNGPYTDFISSIKRLINVGVEKNVLENLIYAGAFDELGYNRHTMIENLPKVIMYANAHKGEIGLLDDIDDKPYIAEFKDDNMVLAENEKKVIGFYLSFNPITSLKKKHNIETDNLYNIARATGYVKGFGLIKRVKSLKTKKGEYMAFVDLVDDKGEISLAVMPKIYREFQDQLVKGKYLYFEGNLERENSCLVKKLKVI